MKEYHTSIIIDSSLTTVWKELTNFKDYPQWNPIVGKLEGEMKVGSKISTFIVPLNKTYFPTLLCYKQNSELVWQGTQGAKFLMAGKHYYKLKSISENQTELLHGEYFTGIFAYFIPSSLLQKMKTVFEQHNILIKQRIENEKK
jgi:hypothetical protein